MSKLYLYVFMYKGAEKYFYASCEEDARSDYKETFGAFPADLVRREPW